MHVNTPTLAERYLSRGYELERPPLPAPFDFLALAPHEVADGSVVDRDRRIAAFAWAVRVPASVLVDVRLMARDLAARPVLVAPDFSDDAKKLADRFGVELVAEPGGEPDLGPPVAAPPAAMEDLQDPVAEPAEHGVAPYAAEVRVHGEGEALAELSPEAHAGLFPVDPIHAPEPPAPRLSHDYPELPTPDELREELAELNRLLARSGPLPPEDVETPAWPTPPSVVEPTLESFPSFPDLGEEEAPVEAVPPYVVPPAPTGPVRAVQAAEASLVAETEEELAELAHWYEDLCAMEELHVEAEALAAWYDEVLDLEARTLEEERRAAAELQLAYHDAIEGVWIAARAAHALAPPAVFEPRAPAVAAFLAVEAAVPALAPPPAAAVPRAPPALAAFAPDEAASEAFLAFAAAVPPLPVRLAVPPPFVEFAPGEDDVVAFHLVEDSVPDLPEGAFAPPFVELAPEEPPAPDAFSTAFEEAAALIAMDPSLAAPTEPRFRPAFESRYIEPEEAASPTPRVEDAVLPATAVLPWTPSPAPRPAAGDGELFQHAFDQAQAWRTVQRIEATRREAHANVLRQTDAPKPTPREAEAPEPDYEIL